MHRRDLNAGMRASLKAGVLGAMLALAAPATATITVFSNTNVGGFVEDTATEAFLSAVGDQPIRHLSFETDKYGLPIPGNVGGEATPLGDIFSHWVDFRSPEATEISPERVLVVGLDPSGLTEPNEVRIGGNPFYQGPLEIRFFQLGEGSTTALGLGGVGFGTASTVTLYDENDSKIGVYSGVSNETFTFIGFVATDGQRIGRALLRGFNQSQFAIQDATFVPEPGALSLAFAALLSLAVLRARSPR